MFRVALVLFAVGCGGREVADAPVESSAEVGTPVEGSDEVGAPVEAAGAIRPVSEEAPTGEGSPPPDPDGAPEPSTDPEPGEPARIYASCRDRVEGPEVDGECTTDADCGAVGCSGEVCVPTAIAEEMFTTCDRRPCFDILDACGCHDGRCTWTVKDALPPMPVFRPASPE